MCVDPITAAAAVASFAGAQSQANAQNQTAMNNAASANLAAQRKYDDTQRKFNYESRSTQQEGYKAAMDAREAAGTAVASAGSSGVSGISVGSILASINQQGAENASRVRTKQDDIASSYTGQVDSIRAEAEGRGLSVPMSNNGLLSGLALGLNILSTKKTT